MTFDEILDHTEEMLQRRGRVSYKAIKRQFNIDDDYLEDIKYELVEILKVAVDVDGDMLKFVDKSPEHESISKNNQIGPKISDSITTDLTAERRQLSVMFIDLVGSTQLSQMLDPEDLREIIYQYQELCDNMVSLHNGIVMQHSGDGIVVYFGYPVAHEDDPIRAITSGLAILGSMAELNNRLSIDHSNLLQVRIGVHTGLVVVGATGGKAHSEITAIGEAPTLAARIQGVADANSMVVSETTNKLVKRRFETKSLGLFNLKGFDKSLELFEVISRRESKLFDISMYKNSTELVGRDEERNLIMERWEKAKNNQGQVVFVNGEAGIGKSHLVHSLVREIVEIGIPFLSFQCSPFNKNTAYQPIIDRLFHEIKYDRKASLETNFENLQIYLSAQPWSEEQDMLLVASLLSIGLPDGIDDLKITPARQKILITEFLLRWFRGKHQPSLILIEDLQWADPSTLELLNTFITELGQMPLLLIATYRPEFNCSWEINAYISKINLHRLDKRASEIIINQVAENLPKEIIQDLLLKTDGNPLFIEEVTKLVLDSGLVKETEKGYQLLGNLKKLTIPDTLNDSLMARLDQLGPAKKVAQIGATIGREFSYVLLKAVSKLDKMILEDYLIKLIKTEMLFVNGDIPEAVYTFKHALIQEAAYSSLLKKQNQLFHKRIVKNLEKGFPDVIAANPELLAHHCLKAGLPEKSIPYWKKAGDLAISRSAHSEALSHLYKGLEVLQTLPNSQDYLDEEILFHISLGVPLTALRGYGSIEVEKAYERARSLCHQAGDTWQMVPALYGLWRYYLLKAQYKEAIELSDQILVLSKSSNDPVHLVVANRASGSTRFYLGDLNNAKKYFEDIFIADVSTDGREDILLYDVVDAWITARSYASLTYWLMGYRDKAIEQSKISLSKAKQLQHPFSIALSLSFASWLYQFLDDPIATNKHASKALEIAEENGFAFWIGWDKILVGWAMGENGSEEQLNLMNNGLDNWYASGSKLGTSYFLFLVAENLMNRGDLKEAWNCLKKANKFTQQSGEKWWQAELFRIEGKLHLKEDKTRISDAENCFRKAIKVAQNQNAKSLELRAATELSKVLLKKGESAEAIKILDELINWFSEGLDLPDMLEARRMLRKAQDVTNSI